MGSSVNLLADDIGTIGPARQIVGWAKPAQRARPRRIRGRRRRRRVCARASSRARPTFGHCYAGPVEWDVKGDNTAAVIFVNVVADHRFKEIDEIAGK